MFYKLFPNIITITYIRYIIVAYLITSCY